MLCAVRWYHALGLLGWLCPAVMNGQETSRFQACVDSCDKAISAGSLPAALHQAGEALVIAETLKDSSALGDVLVKRARIRMMQSDLSASLRDLQRALRIYEAIDDEEGTAVVFNSIGSIHFYDRDYVRARGYYERSLAIHERKGNRSQVATLTGNLGSVLDQMGRPDSALAYHRLHLAMRRSLGQTYWLPVCFTNLGSCFDQLGRSDSALYYLQASVALFPEDHQQDHARVQALTMLGVARLNAGEFRNAIQDCSQSLVFAKQIQDGSMAEESARCLYMSYRALGDATNALAWYQRYIAMRDSLSGEQRAKELLRLELDFTYEGERLADSLNRVDEQRRADFAYQEGLAKERDQKRIFLFSGIAGLLLAIGLWSRLRYIQRSRNLIKQERDRSDKLLLNILPKPIAEELMANGRAAAREVEGVSILFTDFHEFTRMSERLPAQELVAEIDTCFRAFDRIAAAHGLEKIKTIGDAYMAAAGLPDPRPGSAGDAVRAALEMQVWLKSRAMEREAEGLPFFTMRAGIHTGSVVAGIVGDSKFQYDVWGDTVNTAAHLESAGQVGEVSISAATFALVKEEPGLAISPRGQVRIKSKGEMATFFVRRNVEELPTVRTTGI